MKYFFTLLLLFVCAFTHAQNGDRMETVRAKLDALAEADPAYLSTIDLSVSRMPLGELIRNIAKVNQVSISVKGDGNITVSSNFSRVSIVDLIHLLCRQYNLDIDVVGNIVSIYPFSPPGPEVRTPTVKYDSRSKLLSYDLHNSPLPEVARRMADSAGINLIVPAQLAGRQLTGYLVGVAADKAIPIMAESNGLEALNEGGGVWSIKQREQENRPGAGPSRRRDYGGQEISVDSTGLITIQVQQGNIYDIICSLCDRLGLNYYFISPVSSSVSVFLKQVELETLLKVLFTGTQYSYYEEEGIYMFGASQENQAASAQVVQLHNRIITGLADIIPEALKKEVIIKEFADINSLILSGEKQQVARVEQFIKSVDRTVPLVTIDVIIIETSKNYTQDVGLSFGIGSETVPTGGSLSPGIDINVSPSALNRILNSVHDFSSINPPSLLYKL